MSRQVNELERRLAEYFGRAHCIYTGRGATAIYLGLRALSAGSGQVVMPSTLCSSPANAALYAGCEPRFCDVALDDYTMDPASVEAALDDSDSPVAIIAVHMYGYPANMSKLAEIARRRGVVLIEDAAQAVGGAYQGRRLGSFGDMSVVSFGHTKILDVGSGGAVLTDDADLARRIRLVRGEIGRESGFDRREYDDYRTVYYTLRDLARRNPRLNDLFLPLPAIYRDMYLVGCSDAAAEATLQRLPEIETSVEQRRANAQLYAGRLVHPQIRLPCYGEGGAPWRFSVLLNAPIQDRTATLIRAAGIDVSSWYPGLHRWYQAGKAQLARGVRFPNAEYIEDRVLNFWVDPGLDARQIGVNCEVILRSIDAASRDMNGHEKGR